MKETLTPHAFSLGGADAWDPQEGPHLPENFLPIRQFAEISANEKIFLCGRRGSGKSAIARMLELGPAWVYAKAIQGELAEYGEYLNIVNRLTAERESGTPVAIKQCVRRLWTWVLPVAAMQSVLIHESNRSGADPNDLDAIKAYFTSLPSPLTAESSIGHLLSHTFQQAFRLRKDGGIDAFLLDLTNSEAYFAAIKAFQRITRTSHALLVFDTLESYRIFQDAMVEGLQGIIEAINSILADERLQGLSVKLFIPAEIYPKVAAGVPGKVQSRTVYMRWRAADLVAVLARRYLSVLRRTEAVADRELARLSELVDRAYRGQDGRHLRLDFWYANNFLPARIENLNGKEEDTFAYILRHTMRRPRDLITAQMQSILDESVKSGEFPYISARSVVAGVHNPFILQQILTEALAPYEDNFSAALVTAARAAFYKRSVIMSGRELKLFAKELYSLHALASIEPDHFVEMLLQCGVIGLMDSPEGKDTESRAGPYWTAQFEYLMQGNLPLTDRFRYCIHPVMANLFNMVRPSDGRSIYPLPSDDLWLEQAAGVVHK